MPAAPEFLYTAAQTRELDRRAIEDHGIDGYELMERAGAAAFRLLRLRWPAARRVAVFCGGGNNGGDGLVVARLAQAAGFDEVQLGLNAEPSRLQGAAARAWADWQHAGGSAASLDAVDASGADVCVDALLGTGLDRPVRGTIGATIDRLNQAARPVLALDIPSGLDADTGAILGRATRATATVTFIGAKRGLYTGHAPDLTGPVFLEDLSVPAAVHADVGIAVRTIGPGAVRAALPARRPCAHKGDAGHVLVIGGDHGFAGAARMAGEAALRSGAGLVSVATRPQHASAMSAACPELMAHPVEDPARELPDLLARADVVAIGPGLGRGAWGRAALEAALSAGPERRVIDADGLNLLPSALESESVDRNLGETVLTPHPGEAARLLGQNTAAIQDDRFHAIDQLADALGATVLLKGAGSLVKAPGGEVALLPGARPAMAVGGMGDVLTGILGALLAQGLGTVSAARCGAWLHAAAADRAVAVNRGVTVLPMDLVRLLPRTREAPRDD